jgi:GTP-binding protein Era
MNDENSYRDNKKCAVTAIIGRPSAGKSTFVNTASGQKVSIVSAVPQTTRNAVRGIVNSEKGQLVFIDTPGYHKSEKKMNVRMRSVARGALNDADAILYVIDASRKPGAEEEDIAQLLGNFQEKTVAAMNKIDAPAVYTRDIVLFLSERLPEIPVNRIIAMSAEKATNVTAVLDALYEIAPYAHQLYPEDYYTDQQVDFRIKEIIREQAINRLYDEIPHAVYVEIADMEMNSSGKELFVRAFLCVEQESQKGIVIGKGASMIKTIRVESIKELRKILPYRVDLDLRVKVHKNWKKNESILSALIN